MKEAFRTFTHNAIAHPIAGVLWTLADLARARDRSMLAVRLVLAGDWIHDKFLPPY